MEKMLYVNRDDAAEEIKNLSKELENVVQKYKGANFIAITYVPAHDVTFVHFPDTIKLHRAYMQRLLSAAQQHEKNLQKD